MSCVEGKWASQGTASAASDLLATLAVRSGKGTASKLVVALLERSLRLLDPHLSKGAWVKELAPKHAFSWLIINHVKHPNLSQVSSAVVMMATAMLGDTSRLSTRLLGAKLLAHAVAELNAAELGWYRDLVQKELLASVNTRELSLLRLVLPLCVAAAKALGRAFLGAAFESWLESMRYITDPHVRYLFVSNLESLLALLGIDATASLKSLVPIITDSVVVAHPETQVAALGCTAQLLKSCWPRMKHYHLQLLRALSTALLLTQEGPHREEVRNAVFMVARLLNGCCSGDAARLGDFGRALDGISELKELRDALTLGNQ